MNKIISLLIMSGVGVVLAVVPVRTAFSRVSFHDPVFAPPAEAAGGTRRPSGFPAAFIANEGQYADPVLFRADIGDGIVWLTGDAVYYQFIEEFGDSAVSESDYEFRFPGLRKVDRIEYHLVKMTLAGADTPQSVTGHRTAGHTTNFFIGSNPGQWQTNVASYREVIYEAVYPGIDLRFKSRAGRIEYDFLLQPGADPGTIRVRYDGIDSLSLNESGELLIKTAYGNMREEAPRLFQTDGTRLSEVEGRFRIGGDQTVGFEIGPAFNSELPLLIDPVLDYSTLLGGSSSDYAQGIAIDGSGNAFVTGYVTSVDFPVKSPFDSTYDGGGPSGHDAFILKISPRGDSLIFSSFLGGTDGDDRGLDIAVDAVGDVYLTGITGSTDFPTVNAIQTGNDGGLDVFVCRVVASGDSLEYSTYLGGILDDFGSGIDVDQNRQAYVTGNTFSPDFDLSPTPYDDFLGGSEDAFLFKLAADGGSLLYSTFLGGSSKDAGSGVSVDSFGQAAVAGYTLSSDFPTVNPYDGNNDGGVSFGDGFVARFTAAGDSLLFSTFVGGGADDIPLAIDEDSARHLYLTGYTYSGDFPAVNAFDSSRDGTFDAFITKLDSSGGSLGYSTYLGGAGNDLAADIAVDHLGQVCVAGSTPSASFPTRDAYDSTFNGHWDAFVTYLADTGDSLVYSTFLGGLNFEFAYGVAVDTGQNAYVAGYTNSNFFPVQNAIQDTLTGANDLFVTKILMKEFICVDSDGDGFGDPDHPENDCPDDNCPLVPNPGQADADSDGIGNLCDNCPSDANPFQEDADIDGAGDSCDTCTDTDGDGFGDPGFPLNSCPPDNCPATVNPNQEDADLDGVGDSCDTCTDTDNDGFGNPGFPANTCPDDNCPDTSNPGQEDLDGDTVGDACDNCPAVANSAQEDFDSDDVGDSCDTCTDFDGDGFGNPGFPANTCAVDNCPLTFNPGQEDADSNGVGDVCDVGCCVAPLRGNADGDPADEVNVADLSYLVEYLFLNGLAPPCLEEGNADGALPEEINVADLSHLVNYLFLNGPEPAACPAKR